MSMSRYVRYGLKRILYTYAVLLSLTKESLNVVMYSLSVELSCRVRVWSYLVESDCCHVESECGAVL